jgi:hypothetical protein
VKVIQIEADRFAEVATLMEFEADSCAQSPHLQQCTGLTAEQLAPIIDQVHRVIHFHFVRWAQSHGASCVYRG